MQNRVQRYKKYFKYTTKEKSKGSAPTNEVAHAGEGEGEAETGVETGEKLSRHAGDELQTDSQTHHKNNEDIPVEIEEGEERFLALGKTQNARRVTLDEIVKHQRERDGYRDGNQTQPPRALGMHSVDIKHRTDTRN